MTKKLLVGNLAATVTGEVLFHLFEAHGTVRTAEVSLDHMTGTSRGFGVVEMGSDAEAFAARRALDLKDVQGRCITVTAARPKPSKGGGAGRRRG